MRIERSDCSPSQRAARERLVCGPDRLVCGSAWPLALLNGDYGKVWRETVRVIEDVALQDAERILARTALRLYDLDTPVAPAGDPS